MAESPSRTMLSNYSRAGRPEHSDVRKIYNNISIPKPHLQQDRNVLANLVK